MYLVLYVSTNECSCQEVSVERGDISDSPSQVEGTGGAVSPGEQRRRWGTAQSASTDCDLTQTHALPVSGGPRLVAVQVGWDASSVCECVDLGEARETADLGEGKEAGDLGEAEVADLGEAKEVADLWEGKEATDLGEGKEAIINDGLETMINDGFVQK